jgi:hypothetical protein
MAPAPGRLTLGERVVLVDPDDVTLPGDQSEQDPVSPKKT